MKRVRVTLEVSGMENLKQLIAKHEQLIRELRENMERISGEVLSLNAKENQPKAGTNG